MACQLTLFLPSALTGCIIDSYARGRKQHAWLSISSDLHLDAQVWCVEFCALFEKDEEATQAVPITPFSKQIVFLVLTKVLGRPEVFGLCERIVIACKGNM
jgi:hypothetical protein